MEQTVGGCGGRLTRQRQAVLDIVSALPGHPTAGHVYAAAREQGADIAYATVYNALHYLVESGRIATVQRVDGVVSYDHDTLPHDHVICRLCGSFDDVPHSRVADSARASYEAVGRASGYRIEGHMMHFVGLCRSCALEEERRG